MRICDRIAAKSSGLWLAVGLLLVVVALLVGQLWPHIDHWMMLDEIARNPSSVESFGLWLSIRKAEWNGEELVVDLVLAWGKRDQWALNPANILFVRFLDQDGNYLSDDLLVRITLTEAFCDHEIGYFETRMTIYVPQKANSLVVRLGESGLQTKPFNLPVLRMGPVRSKYSAEGQDGW